MMTPASNGETTTAAMAAPGKMTRLRAERVVAAAQRLSGVENARRATTDDTPTSVAKQRLPVTSTVAVRIGGVHDAYLQHSGVSFLLEDVVKRLQEEKPENPGVFIANYFAGVVNGSHVRGREFEYVNATLQNRIAFVSLIQRALENADRSIVITSGDFAEIIWCHCSDVPVVLLNQACSHIDENPDGAVLSTLEGFLVAFFACFVYNDFLCKAHEVYSELAITARDSRAPSPRGKSESIASAMAADRIVARLRLTAQQATLVIPPLGEVETLVFKSPSFKEFCAFFFSSTCVLSSIHELQTAFAALASSSLT